MRAILSLGIRNSLLRVFVWLAGCVSLSVTALLAGFGVMLVLGLFYAVGVSTKLIEDPP